MDYSTIKNRRWYIVAGVLFLIFLILTPINIYHSMGYFLSLFQGIVFGFFIFIAILELESFRDILYINEEENPILQSRRIVIIPFVAAIVSSIIFFLVTSERIDVKLKSYGIKTMASVDDGSRTTTSSVRRGEHSSYKLDITFKLKDGSYYQTSTDVPQEIYTNVFKGEKIELLYLPENPSIIKILVGDENVQKFIGISNRDLNFKDLETIMDMKIDSIGEYLNKISTKWDIQNDSIGRIFVNENKKALLAVSFNGNILYKSRDILSINDFMKGVNIIGKQQEKEKGTEGTSIKSITTYTTTKYIVQHVMSIGKQMEFYLTIKHRE